MNFTDPDVSTPKKNTPKRSWLGVLIGVFFLGSLAGGACLGYYNWELEQTLAEFDGTLEVQAGKIGLLQEASQAGFEKQAQKVLLKAEEERVVWSLAVRDILGQIESEEVAISQLQSGENNQFFLEGQAQNLLSIAKLINRLKNHQYFNQPFVSNTNNQELEVLGTGFNLNFSYENTGVLETETPGFGSNLDNPAL